MSRKALSARIIQTILITILLTVSALSAAKAPRWVLTPPNEKGYYSGVGSATIQPGSSSHVETARQDALAAIASQIKVSISSDVVSSLMAEGNEISEDFKKNIQTSTQAQLEGYEMVDQYQEGNTYYALYRLSEAKYARIQAEKRRKAAELAASYYDEYQKDLKKQDEASALNNLIRALESMDSYIPEGLEGELDGNTVFLGNVFLQKIQALMDAVTITADPKSVQMKAGETLKNAAFVVTANGHALKNITLNLSVNGEGNELGHPPVSDAGGRAGLGSVRIRDTKKIQILKAELKLGAVEPGGAMLYPVLLARMNKPVATMMLQVRGPQVYMQTEELLDGKSIDMNRIEPVIKDILTSAGYTITEDPAGADFMMEIKASSRRGSQVQQLYSAFADLTVSVTDLNDGNEVFKKGLKQVKGIDLDFVKAQLKAYDSIGKKVRSDMEKEILDSMR